MSTSLKPNVLKMIPCLSFLQDELSCCFVCQQRIKHFASDDFLYAKANFKFMIFLNQLPTLTKEYIVCNLDNELTWVINETFI